MKGKCNNPRGYKRRTKGGEKEERSWTAFRGFVEFLRRGSRGKGESARARRGGKKKQEGRDGGGARNVASVSLSARGPYTEGRYRGGGSPPLRIVYRCRFKKGMTFYRAARSISRAREWREVRLFFSPPPPPQRRRNDLVAAALSGASTENTRTVTNITFYSNRYRYSCTHPRTIKLLYLFY